MDDKQMTNTSYPSIDKPWMKWYTDCGLPYYPQQTLFDNIWNNNKNNLNDIALHYFGKKITYKELFSMIHLAELKLDELDIKFQDAVAFIGIYTPEMIALFYALNKIGAVSCMMDPRTAPESLAKYIQDARVKCLFLQDACCEVAQKVLMRAEVAQTVVLSTSVSMGFPIKYLYSLKKKITTERIQFIHYESIKLRDGEKNAKEEKQVDNVNDIPAVVCYTGGTTGNSKGVLLSNGNLNSIVEQFRVMTGGFERQQKWLSPSVPFITYFLNCSLHMPLAFGMQCYIELYDNANMMKKVKKHRIHHVAATPSFFEEFITDSEDFSYIIMPTTGGDKLSERAYNQINKQLEKGKCNWKICNGYGMTEVSSGACISYKGKSNKANSVGIPLINTIVTAFDIETGEEVSIGRQGEICISGPGVMIGYLNNREATDEIIKVHHGKRWIHTGDIGYIDEDGCVFVVGRMKRMIIRFDGFKIFPAVVEEKMLTCCLIEDCSCVAMKDERHDVGQVPVVFYTMSNANVTCEFVEQELRKISEELLPEYSQPYDYKMIDELPRTHAGKIDYRKLEEMAKR